VRLATPGHKRLIAPSGYKLTDEQTEALIRELSQIIQNDRYPFSPRIRALKDILGQLRPEPDRPAPLPPRRHYEPPSRGRYAITRLHRNRGVTPEPVSPSLAIPLLRAAYGLVSIGANWPYGLRFDATG
jgi:hypothetical protein